MPGNVAGYELGIGDDHGSAVDLPLDVGELPPGTGELVVVRGLVEEVEIVDREDHRHARIERPVARHLVGRMPGSECRPTHHRPNQRPVEALHGLLPPRGDVEPPEPSAQRRGSLGEPRLGAPRQEEHRLEA